MCKLGLFTFVFFLLAKTTFASNDFISVEKDTDKAPLVSAFHVQLTSLSNHVDDDRAKRIIHKDIGYRLSFEGVGREFDYFVKLNRKLALFEPNSTFSLWDGDQLISRRTHETYLIFDNTNEEDGILPDELAQVVVTPRGELVNAIVQKDGETYTLERLEHVQPSLEDHEHKRFASESEWVMHKHSDIKGFSKGYKDCGSDTSDVLAEQNAKQPLEKKATNVQNKRNSQFPSRWANCFTPSTTRTMSVGVAVDVSFYRRLNSDTNLINNQIVSVFAHSNYIYYYQVGIVLTAGEVIVQTTEGGPAWNHARPEGQARCSDSPSTRLDQFSTWIRSNRPNPTFPEGLWHLFTDCFPPSGVVGVAWLGVLCRSPFSNAAHAGLSSYSANWWTTVAHEIGHNFKARHPFDMGATQGVAGGIMDYGDGMVNNIFQFNSDFARNDVCTEISRAIGLSNTCIRAHSSTCGNGIVEFGEACDDTSSCCIQPGNPGACTLAPGAECSNECCDNCRIRPTWFTCEIPGHGPDSGHCGWGKCSIPGTTKYSNTIFCPIQQANPCVYRIKFSPTGSCFSGSDYDMWVMSGALCSATNSQMRCNGLGSCVNTPSVSTSSSSTSSSGSTSSSSSSSSAGSSTSSPGSTSTSSSTSTGSSTSSPGSTSSSSTSAGSSTSSPGSTSSSSSTSAGSSTSSPGSTSSSSSSAGTSSPSSSSTGPQTTTGSAFGNNPLGRADDESDEGNALGIGIGIVAAALVLVGFSAFVFFLVRRRRSQVYSPPSTASNSDFRGVAQPNTISAYTVPAYNNAPSSNNFNRPPPPNNPPNNFNRPPPAYPQANNFNRPPPTTTYTNATAPPFANPRPNPPVASGPQQFRVGTICQAKYTADGMWYKAKILQINGNRFLVNYVDFGNDSEWVPLSSLRA